MKTRVWDAAASRMRCMSTMHVLQRYLDGALDEDGARRVAGHLEECRRCGLEAEIYQEIKAALAGRMRIVDRGAIERLGRFAAQLAQGSASPPGGHGA